MFKEVRAKACWTMSFIVVLGSACWGSALKVTTNRNDKHATAEESMSYVDARNPTLRQPIGAADDARDFRFVQVEVVEVQNRKRYAATFRVEYETKANEKIVLGTFSLYPSDGPGRFVVPAQGKLRNEGAIVLSLVIPDDFKSGDVLRAGVRKMRFVNE